MFPRPSGGSCWRLGATTITPTADLRSEVTGALTLIETSPDSVDFVLENLRRFRRDLPDEVRALGLLRPMRRLIERARTAGEVRADVNARMAHFNELLRPASQMAADILNLIDRGLGA